MCAVLVILTVMSYAFAPGVHACLADGRLVVLNLAADRYLMLPPAMDASIRRLLDGEPESPRDRLLHQRLCTGGLVLQPAHGQCLTLCEAALPSRSLLDEGWSHASPWDVAIAALGVVQARTALRLGGLQRSLGRIATITPPALEDHTRAVALASAFLDLRLAIRSLDRCLPLSIALAADAKRRHAGVRLVLGVKCNPFGAHAWVQLGPSVLNDRLDAVRAFTPILSL